MPSLHRTPQFLFAGSGKQSLVNIMDKMPVTASYSLGFREPLAFCTSMMQYSSSSSTSTAAKSELYAWYFAWSTREYSLPNCSGLHLARAGSPLRDRCAAHSFHTAASGQKTAAHFVPPGSRTCLSTHPLAGRSGTLQLAGSSGSPRPSTPSRSLWPRTSPYAHRASRTSPLHSFCPPSRPRWP
jgi:hypothetical protein